jgi:cell wall-associated NlpC family hydrolase
MEPGIEAFVEDLRKTFIKHEDAIRQRAETAMFEIKEATYAAMQKIHEGFVPPPGPLESLPEPAPIPPSAPIESMPQAFTDQDAEDIPDESTELPPTTVYEEPDIPDEDVEEFQHEDQRNIIITAARAAYGMPYKFGGGDETGPTVGIVPRETERGFDCSGLVFFAFHLAGFEGHPRTSQGLYEAFRDKLIPYEDTKPGDLMFTNFKGKDHLPDHVSIIAPEDHKVIEAGDPVGLYGIGDRGETKYARIFND